MVDECEHGDGRVQQDDEGYEAPIDEVTLANVPNVPDQLKQVGILEELKVF